MKNRSYVEIINNFEKMIMGSNIPYGVHIVQPNEKILKQNINKGYLFVGYGTDALFLINASELPEGLL